MAEADASPVRRHIANLQRSSADGRGEREQMERHHQQMQALEGAIRELITVTRELVEVMKKDVEADTKVAEGMRGRAAAGK